MFNCSVMDIRIHLYCTYYGHQIPNLTIRSDLYSGTRAGPSKRMKIMVVEDIGYDRRRNTLPCTA